MHGSFLKTAFIFVFLNIIPFFAYAGAFNEGEISTLTKLAVNGDPVSQWLLGQKEFQDKNYPNALKWFRKSAEQKTAPAQYSLGLMYTTGTGIIKDQAEAAKWFQKAAEQGHAKAQFFIATMYEEGEGVKQSNAEAIKWYKKAAAQGSEDALNNLRVLRSSMGYYSNFATWMTNDLLKHDPRFSTGNTSEDLANILVFLNNNSRDAQIYKTDALKRFEEEKDSAK